MCDDGHGWTPPINSEPVRFPPRLRVVETPKPADDWPESVSESFALSAPATPLNKSR